MFCFYHATKFLKEFFYNIFSSTEAVEIYVLLENLRKKQVYKVLK